MSEDMLSDFKAHLSFILVQNQVKPIDRLIKMKLFECEITLDKTARNISLCTLNLFERAM